MAGVGQPDAAAPAEFKGRGIEAYKRMFARAEETCAPARKLAHRDRDWHDNFDDSQWDAEEKKILNGRKQPIVTSNHIKRKVKFLCGLEQKQRTDPKAYPRRPDSEKSASMVTQVLDFIEEETRFDHTASAAFPDLCVEGIEAAEVIVENGETVAVNLIQYDSFFYDPRSKKKDFSDASYLGYQDWFDLEEAFELFAVPEDDPEAESKNAEIRNLLEGSFEDGNLDEGYEDKPYQLWGDSERKRVRIACMYWKTAGGQWNYTYFSGSGVLREGVSIYLDDKGRPDCAIIAASAQMTRKNERFGVVRDMISPQSEMNYRRSMSLHYLRNRRMWARAPGILPADAKEQVARADGILIANGNFGVDWGFIDSNAEITGNLELLQEAKGEMAVQGPNAGLQGRGTEDQSGKAIALQQNAGLAEENDVFDIHNDWKLRIYRAMWARAKQFKTEEWFIRITGENDAVQFLHVNQPVYQMDPMTGQPVQGPDGKPVVVAVNNRLAEVDADIVLMPAPDMITLQHEEFEKLTRMVEAGVPIPPDIILEASQIKNKDKLVERLKKDMDLQAKLQQAGQQIEQMGKAMEAMQKQLADAQMQKPPSPLDLARAQESAAKTESIKTDTMLKVREASMPSQPEQMTPMDAAKIRQMDAQTGKTQIEGVKTLNDIMNPPPPPRPNGAPPR